MFSHERLKVYNKTLACVGTLMEYSASCDKRHAVVDHLARASESIVLNLAEATRLRSIGHKQHTLEYAIGSGPGIRRLPGYRRSEAIPFD